MALATGDVMQVGKGTVWGPDHFDTPCAVDYCSAACLMMRRSDFLKVGGFGFEWEPAYYEDTDLCLKLWTNCGKVMVNPLARVVHIESKTTSDYTAAAPGHLRDQPGEVRQEVGRLARSAADLASRRPRPRAADGDGRAERGGPRAPGCTAHAPPDPQFVLYSPYQLVPGGGERLSVRGGVAPVLALRDAQRGLRHPAALQRHPDAADRGDVRVRARRGTGPPVGRSRPGPVPLLVRHRELRRPPGTGVRRHGACTTSNSPSGSPTRRSRREASGWAATTRSGCTRSSSAAT